MSEDYDPLVASPPKEVPLRNAPLVRVIAQVRFPPILLVEKPEFIAPFQEAMRETYPDLRREHTQSLLAGPQGLVSGEQQVGWRLTDSEQAWRVSLTPAFVALETTAYTSRRDFMKRMRTILSAVQEHFKPAAAGRVGLRYIDRITGEGLDDIAELVRPEMLGIVNTPLLGYMQHALSETLLALPESGHRVLVRWGHLPPKSTADPNAVEPISERSWILDIDMFSAEQRPFSAAHLTEDLNGFAERIYTVFRWAVTDEFLRRYGGEP